MLAGPQAERMEEAASEGSSAALAHGGESEVEVMVLVHYSDRCPHLQCLVHVRL